MPHKAIQDLLLLRYWLQSWLLCFCMLHASIVNSADNTAFNYVPINLPQQTVSGFLEDQQGYLWLGTGTGLVRYDGVNSLTFQHEPGNPQSLIHNNITYLMQSRRGDVWISTQNGISRYLPGIGFQNYLRDPAATERNPNIFYKILEDSQGRIWAAGTDHLYQYQEQSDSFKVITDQQQQAFRKNFCLVEAAGELWLCHNKGLARLSANTSHFSSVYSGQQVYSMQSLFNEQWLFTTGDLQNPDVRVGSSQGTTQLLPELKGTLVFLMDKKQRLWSYGYSGIKSISPDLRIAHSGSPGEQDSPYSVLSMLETRQGDLYASSSGGVFRFQSATDSWQEVSIDKSRLLGVTGMLYETRDGTLLLGSMQSGLFRYVPTARKFQHYNPPKIDDYGAYGGSSIRVVYEELYAGNHWLWLGTQSFVKRLTLSEDGSKVLKIEPFDIRKDIEQHTVVDSIQRLDTGTLLVSTKTGLRQQAPLSSSFVPSPLQQLLPLATTKRPLDTNGTEVLDIHLTSDCLWLATNTGLGCASTDGQRIIRWYHPQQYPAFDDNYLFNIYQAKDGALWLSSEQGVIRFEPATNELLQFRHQPDNPQSLAHNWVHGVWQTADDTYWIATREGGLNQLRWRPGTTPVWQRFGTKQGLPSEVLYGILGDTSGKLWFSSSNGIFSFDPTNFNVRSYQLADGLQSTEFNFSVMHIGPSGRFYFGGVNGVNGFEPAKVLDNQVAPALVLQQVLVNEQALPLAMNEAESYQLRHQQNYLTFQYAGLHYADPTRIRYAYQLQGNDQDWLQASENYARYGALPPGDYQFWLKAANPDGVWSEPQLMFRFNIAPHPLLSGWALLSYLLLAVLALLAYIRYRDRAELGLKVKIAQGVARENALNRSLQVQFESTAHEMRTPLMRLRTRLERGIKVLQGQAVTTESAVETPSALHHLKLATEASDELQLLISRHLELEELRLKAGIVKLHLPAKPAVEAEIRRYQPYLQEKQQHLVTDLHDVVWCGMPGIVELITANLLSNACKYTQIAGEIRLTLQQQDNWVQFTVSDNGPGIPVNQQQDVFLRHYRMAGQENIPGSGEGLYLVKNAVNECGGKISIASAPGEGCTFNVRLPLGELSKVDSSLLPDRLVLSDIATALVDVLPVPEPARLAQGQQTVLVVEDNNGLRQDLDELLSTFYRCITAANAAQGWQLARKHLPDIIISDVMMEQKDSGFRLLQQIKSQVETSHIPVILLTALGDEHSQQTGYSCQADVYLCKSITDKKLLSVIETQLNQHWRKTEYIRRALQQLPTNETCGENAIFVAKLHAVFSEIYQQIDIKTEDIACYFYKSASQLNRLSKACLQHSVIEALTRYRMDKARMMLEQPDHSLTIEEIGEQCGFGSVKTFQRQCLTQFGVTPHEYRQGKRTSQRLIS